MADRTAQTGACAAIALLAFALAGCMQAPDPSEAISGDWQAIGQSHGNEARISYKLGGGSLESRSSDGSSFDAPLDGSVVDVAGRPGTEVSVHPIPVVAFRQVFRSDGRPVRIVTVAVVNRNRLVIVDERGGLPPRAVLAARR